MNKKMKKTLKIVLVILIILALILGFVFYRMRLKEKAEEITLDNLPELEYTEDQAKEFYSKKLIKHLDTFKNGFHIKYTGETVDEKGEILTFVEEFSKKGDMLSLYKEDENYRILIDNNYFYHVDENEFNIYQFKKEDKISLNMDVLFYSLDSINSNFVSTGNEILDDGTYYFEEYRMEKDNTVLVRYYFDNDDNIKFIKAYKDNSSVQTFIEVQSLEKKTYEFMFDMSERYEVVEF